ncbi:toxin-antitoxin system HicB family antitoxin [Planobispora takensis]|uniref:Toxin-antitoxin system HicB family antitoxin n=1 Tax=Planobispora takensis TaxID=1367882 RepID=A0A8J3SVR2_9ACTN|nr:toxin-antitoxin system HicB family antitoxin [Planobispora takensis]GII01529.1 hypothetical protein Pta02_35370 [Planobispora takensis]
MELTSYIDGLRRELTAAAEVAGPEVREAAERLASALDPAVRLTLMDVLSDAADEVTREIDPGVVEVRIRGREPQFVVSLPQEEPAGSHDFPPGFPFPGHFPPGFPFSTGRPPMGPPGPPGPPHVPSPPHAPVPPEPPAPPGETEQGTARMTLRLPEALKARVEQAAAGSGVSVNAWLVRALTAAVADPGPGPHGPGPHGPGPYGSGRRLTGWSR